MFNGGRGWQQQRYLRPTKNHVAVFVDISKMWDHASSFWFQSVGKTLLPPLLTDFVWSLLMKLSVPDQSIASEAATILKLTLECNAHKVTMVRHFTMSGGVQSTFSNGLFLPFYMPTPFHIYFLPLFIMSLQSNEAFCVK